MHKRHAFIILLLCIIFCGCTTLHNNNLPFSAFTGQEVILQREAVLSEYPAYGDEQLLVLWEDGKPTQLVIDSKLMHKPAREITTSWGTSQSTYPLTNYPKRLYYLDNSSFVETTLNDRMQGGPVEVFHLPKGTALQITRSYTSNGIDSVCHRSEGTVVHPRTGEKVHFSYLFSCSDSIERAPWEDDSVPEKRFVGWDGNSYKGNK